MRASKQEQARERGVRQGQADIAVSGRQFVPGNEVNNRKKKKINNKDSHVKEQLNESEECENEHQRMHPAWERHLKDAEQG
jgi:hypothetical protein